MELGIISPMTVVRRYLAVVIVCTIIGAAIAAAYSWTRSSQYMSTTRLFFTTSSSDIIDLYQATLAGQARVQTYKVLATDPKVLDNAIRATGVAMDRDTLASNMTVDVPPGTIILDVTVTDSDNRVAANLANAVSDGLIGLVGELEKPLGGGPSPVALVIVQPAMLSPAPQPKLGPVQIGIGGVAGFAVGLLLASVINGVRNRRKRRNEDPVIELDRPDEVDHGAATMSIADADR